jgi:exodeoxyribonuclease VII large subunit
MRPFRSGLADTGLTRPSTPQGIDPKTGRPKAWTVAALTRHLKDTIERGYGSVWVEGEISNFKVYGSGHIYFTLKDESAQLSAVIWRASAERLKYLPKDGDRVLVGGRLTVYEQRGQYQLVVDKLEPLGLGDLAAAFEQLKRKLDAEGLFAPERKRPLPAFPRRVGIVTSPTGAALHDLLRVIFGRWPMEIVLAGVRVQGAEAAGEIVAAIRAMNELPPDERPDVLIVGRGGGSLEDLWAFNEEPVARAIVASEIPVVSAVGHEIDFTIADFAADLRAATPSHAGEITVPRLDHTRERLAGLSAALPLALTTRVELARERLNVIEQSYALRHPEQRVAMARQRIDELTQRLGTASQRVVERLRERISSGAGQLDALSPLRVLERGYSITRDEQGRLIRSTEGLAAGATIQTRVADGEFQSEIKTVTHRKRKEGTTTKSPD